MFKIGSEHFNASNSGPWETVGRTDYRLNIDHEKKLIYLTGQATSQRSDWFDNLNFGRRWFKGVRVHSGFLRQYLAVRDILMGALYEHRDYALRVDGFSLGASWTQIFIYDAIYHFPDRDIKAILYAPGNPWCILPRHYRKALRRCVTFVYCYWDVVTWMRLIGFKRYGKNVRIGRIWRLWPKQHHPNQITRALEERR